MHKLVGRLFTQTRIRMHTHCCLTALSALLEWEDTQSNYAAAFFNTLFKLPAGKTSYREKNQDTLGSWMHYTHFWGNWAHLLLFVCHSGLLCVKTLLHGQRKTKITTAICFGLFFCFVFFHSLLIFFFATHGRVPCIPIWFKLFCKHSNICDLQTADNESQLEEVSEFAYLQKIWACGSMRHPTLKCAKQPQEKRKEL